MGLFNIATDELQSKCHIELAGLEIEVETLPGIAIDEERLVEWVAMIAIAVANGEFSHNDLVEERVHLRIFTQNGDIINTIKNRELIDRRAFIQILTDSGRTTKSPAASRCVCAEFLLASAAQAPPARV